MFNTKFPVTLLALALLEINFVTVPSYADTIVCCSGPGWCGDGNCYCGEGNGYWVSHENWSGNWTCGGCEDACTAAGYSTYSKMGADCNNMKSPLTYIENYGTGQKTWDQYCENGKR